MSFSSLKMLVTCVLVAMMLFTLSAHAANPVIIADEIPSSSLGRYMEFLVDPDATLDLAAVQSARVASPDEHKPQGAWQEVAKDNILGGFTSEVYWVRFTVDNTSSKDREWLLEANYALLDLIELYEPDGQGGFRKTVAGDQFPYAQRPLDFSNITFPIVTEANSSETYYLRFQTAGAMSIQLNMWSKDDFVSAFDGPVLIHGFLYGIVFLGAIYSLMNAIFMRERMYVFVAIGILSSSGYSMGINGFGYQFIWPDNVWFQNINIAVFLNLCFGFTLLFSREFLQLARVAPRIDKTIVLLSVFCLICAALSLVLPYAIMIRITSVATILMALLGLGAGVVSYLSGYKAARFYMPAWLAVVVGASTFALKSLGILPANLFTIWAQEFAFAWVAFFLTISQSDHFFQARRAHEAAQSGAMDAIRNAEHKYRSLFENAIEGIFQMTMDGKLINANKAFARILGSRDIAILLEQSQQPFSLGCLSDAERDRFRSILEKEEGVSDFETSFKLHADGGVEEHWISISAQKVRSGDGTLHYEGAMADITETKKRLQAEKQRHMAEASTEAKSLFLANMSHEIRTPMNAIIGFTDLALERNSDPQLNEFLRKTRLASGNLLGIINDILDFSKIEAGKLEIEDTPFSLQEVLNNLKNIVSITVASKNLGFNVVVDEDIPDKLIGDPLRIGQVLLNLTNNAIKFTQQGQVTVEIELQALDKKDMTIQLVGRIRDTGIGIPPDKLKNLFSSFTQADQSTTRRFGGTGLGLSISKQLVEMMGGKLTVESVVDQGSTFIFSLKCRIQDRRQRSNPHFAGAEMPLNVLVVDDQPDARELMEKALLSLAHHVTCVSSAELAIDELRAKQEAGTPYDVLIADWFMPDMDGIRCCQYIQENEQFIKPRMVIVTGYDLEDAKQQAKQVGIDAFMLKPIKVPELSGVLKQVFTDRRTAEQERADSQHGEPPRYDFTGAKVLLVDDVAMNQELAQAILSKRGFDVSIANNGQEAVDAVRADRFDLVLMDMQMPVLDGCQATEKIREFNRRLPIIAMTANAMTGDKIKCLAAGMNDYVTKPINPDELFRTIARWFKPTGQTQAKVEASASAPTAAQTESEATLPDSLPGIELKQGIQRCEGNVALYLKLLADFKRNYSDSPSRLDALIEKNAQADIASLGHALKGVAGNLSALTLSGIGAALEKACALEQSELDQQVTRFKTELPIVLASIDLLIAQRDEQAAQTPQTAVNQIDPGSVADCLTELKNLIQAQMLEAFDLAADYAQRWPVPAQIETLKALVDALDRFDFKEAEVLIAELQGM